MRVTFIGIYSKGPAYPRARNLIRMLRDQGAEVAECHHEMASDYRSRVEATRGVLGKMNFVVNLALSYPALWRKFRELPSPDMVVVGHPCWFHVHLVKLFSRRCAVRPTLVADAFFPLLDALVDDRGLVAPDSWLAQLLFKIESGAYHAADFVLIDTHVHAKYLAEHYRLDPARVVPAPVGPTVHPPYKMARPKAQGSKFDVLFIGTFIPLHGVDVIVEAARILQESDGSIQICMIGTGQLRGEAEERARALNLDNLRFEDWIEADRIPARLMEV